MKLMHADTEHISPLRLRELEQHEQDVLALRRQQAELLAALDALVANWREIVQCRMDEHYADPIGRERLTYCADRLVAELAKHR